MKSTVIEVCTELLISGTFSSARLNYFTANSTSKQQKLMEKVISCYPIAVSLMGSVAADLLMKVLRNISTSSTRPHKRLFTEVDKENLQAKRMQLMIEHAQIEAELETVDFKLFDFDDSTDSATSVESLWDQSDPEFHEHLASSSEIFASNDDGTIAA